MSGWHLVQVQFLSGWDHDNFLLSISNEVQPSRFVVQSAYQRDSIASSDKGSNTKDGINERDCNHAHIFHLRHSARNTLCRLSQSTSLSSGQASSQHRVCRSILHISLEFILRIFFHDTNFLRVLFHSAYLPALERLKDKYTLVAVYSRSLSSASALAKSAAELLKVPEPSLALYHDQGGSSTDLNTLLSSTSISAVIITLPITIQPGIVLAALRAGKHVLSEKPIAADVTSGYSLITEYQEKYAPSGLHWRIAENFECEPAFIKAAEAIQAGRIGKISHWRLSKADGIETDNPYYKTTWRTVPDYQGGFVVRDSSDLLPTPGRLTRVYTARCRCGEYTQWRRCMRGSNLIYCFPPKALCSSNPNGTSWVPNGALWIFLPHS